MLNLKDVRSFAPRCGGTTVVSALAMAFAVIFASGMAHGQNFQLIHTFVGPEGAQPVAGVVFDRGGKLYGSVLAGHSGSNWGGVYQMRRAGTGWVFNTLYIFDGTLQSRPVFGPEGLLYGTSPNNLTGYPYGYLYNLRPAVNACTAALCPWNFTWMYGFLGGADGGTPRYGDLTFDQAGNMYGTGSLGGDANSDGVVFKAVNSGGNWIESAIYTFSGTPDGSHPFAGVVLDSAGNLWGTTTAGGTSGNGTVFELTPNGGGWTEHVIYSFSGSNDGGCPVGGLTFDGAGSLYGTTKCDGANGFGSVFKLSPNGGGWSYTSLYDFTAGNDGKFPYGNVTFDSSGNIFGTASFGGQHNAGTVWEITP